MQRNRMESGLKGTVATAAFCLAVCAAAGIWLLAKKDFLRSGFPSADFEGGSFVQNPADRAEVSWGADGEESRAEEDLQQRMMDLERQEQALRDSAQQIGEACSDIYEEAAARDLLMSQEAMERMVRRLGKEATLRWTLKIRLTWPGRTRCWSSAGRWTPGRRAA